MSVFDNLIRLVRNIAMRSGSTDTMSEEKPAINLLRGWPSTSLLPVDLLKEAVNHVLSDTSIAYPGLLYGPDPGYEPCREAIAKWLNSFYKPRKSIGPSRICITGGASQSLGCMLGVYTDPEYTRNIWIVAPAYMLVFKVFQDAGFADKLRAVPEDEGGIDIAYLRREIQKSEEKAKSKGNTEVRYKSHQEKVYKHVVYCVPAFSNPSSRTMSLRTRRELVKLAREFDALVACDDVYDFLQWPADISDPKASGTTLEAMKSASLPRLVDIDRELDGGAECAGADGFGNVVSNGTFSKIAGPGLRSGWVEGTPQFAFGVSQAGIQRSGGAPSQLTSTYVTQLLSTGQIQNHIETVLRPAYASRYKTMTGAIEQHLRPLGFTMPQPDRDVVGGYFIWLSLPIGLKATNLAQKCQADEKLIVAPGNLFEVPGDHAVQFGSSIRLCFAWEDEPKLADAIKRIAAVTKRLQDGQADSAHDFVVVDKSEGNLQGFM